MGGGRPGTVRDDYEAVAWKNAEAARALEMPPISAYGLHIFRLYLRMAGWRTSNGFGANPIQPEHVLGWQRLYGVSLPIFVVELIFEIDTTFRRAHAAQLERNRPAGAGEDAGVDAAEP